MSGRGDGRTGGYEQIPTSFIRKLEERRRRLVDAQEENDVNLDALGDFLYPDTAHLVFELLQNAEDARATTARFDLRADSLSFAHDGEPFSQEDLKNITNYFKSSKYETEDKIGRFGIGFKSVFACTETPRIYSDTVAFEIVDRIVPRPIVRPASSMISATRETVIELPFDAANLDAGCGQSAALKPAEEAAKEIRRGLERMSAMSILHLAHIKSIAWKNFDGAEARISRTELEDGVVRIDVVRVSAGGMPDIDKKWFLRFRESYAERSPLHLDVVFELEERTQEQDELPVVDQVVGNRFRIVPARGMVSVFFPAKKETSNLRFHVHAPFIPELSRASIKEHSDNEGLLRRLAALAARSLSSIRDLGMLNREFLGVLPNSRDPLPKAYDPFHSEMVEAMATKSLVPMQGGGHGAGRRLVRGPADLKALFRDVDICFLLSGHVPTQPNDSATIGAARTHVSYQGWAVAATRRNSEVDHLLSDLDIREFEVWRLALPGRKAREIIAWLATHDVAWHTEYYAALERHWNSKNWTRATRPSRESHFTVHEDLKPRLRRIPLVRTRTGEYALGCNVHFTDDGTDGVADGVTFADPDIYSVGKAAENARRGLERLGVRDLDADSRVAAIVDKYYGESGRRPSPAKHIGHIGSLVELLKLGGTSYRTLRDGLLLVDVNGEWARPSNLYAGSVYVDSVVEPYYRVLAGTADDLESGELPVRFQLHPQYRDVPGFGGFARRLGVSYDRLPIVSAGCMSNPQRSHLASGGGVYFTDNGTDDDWIVPCLDMVLQSYEGRNRSEAERMSLARAIHATFDGRSGDRWPPSDDVTARGSQWGDYQPSEQGCLIAIFRRNTNARFRAAPSQVVFTLRRRAWVPQNDNGGLIFVRPSEAEVVLLPEWFPVVSGAPWVRAVEFGREGQQAKKEVESRVAERAEVAKKLFGTDDREVLEWLKWVKGLSLEDRRAVREQHESRTRPSRSFDSPSNPVLRRRRARQRAKDAPARRPQVRERSIVEGDTSLKEDARTQLRAIYTEHAYESLCQVKDCLDRSFRIDGAWYFEAVRFLKLGRMVAGDYIALCPRHAAMFRHALERNGLRQRFLDACADEARGDYEPVTVAVVLAGEKVDILIAPKHAIDLEEALKVDNSRD